MTVARIALAVLALRGARWAYVSFIMLGLAYFPMRVGFALQPRACQLTFDAPLAAHSLTNIPHIVLFGVFFMFSAIHFGGWQWGNRSVLLTAAAMTLLMGALVEVAEGVTGSGNCRLRDLIPDSAGVLWGTVVMLGLAKLPIVVARGQRRQLVDVSTPSRQP